MNVKNVMTIGEAMGLMVANEEKKLKDVEHFTRYACGAELNFAVGIARLGHKMTYVSRLGKDPFGDYLLDFLKENHIDSRYVTQDNHYMTGMQLKAKNPHGDPEVVNFRNHTAFSHFSLDTLPEIAWDGLDHLHLTGIPLALTENCREVSFAMAKMASAHRVQISFDTNLRPALWRSEEAMKTHINALAALSDIVLPGLSEGQLLTGLKTEQEIAEFYLDAGAKAVVVKLGAKGSYVNNGRDKFYAPAYVVEVVDTVGAGDGFAVGLVSALLEGLSWQDAALRAAAVGGMATMSEGDSAGLPTPSQLADFQQHGVLR